MLFAGALTSVAALLPAAQALPSSVDDHGVFELFVEGRPVGTEKFEIRSGKDGVEAQAEIHLRVDQGGKTVDEKSYPSLTLNSKLYPVSYTWSQKGSQSSDLQADFRSSPAKTRYKTVTGQEDDRDFQLPPDVAVLDDNVVHHYQLIVNRYRWTSGGKQTFHVFIPQEAMPGDITVEEAGPEEVKVGETSLNLQHLVVTAELARIDLWVDGQQHLQRISIPEAHFEGVRKK